MLALLAVLAFAARGTFSTTATQDAGQLTAVAFSNLTAGYGLFEQQGTTTCTYSVGTTDDGGARFSALARVTTWPCAGGAPAGWLAFDDSGDGFLYGPMLFETHDGGATWAPSTQPGAVLAVDAVGSSVWMLERVCAAAAHSAQCPLRLLVSGDGGASFAPARHQPPLTLARSFLVDPGSAQGQSWLVRVNARAAYVLAPPAGGNSAPLLYTGDGGSSWSGRTSPCPAGLSTVLSVAPAGALFAVCAGEPSAGAQGKSSAVSTDGGRSWTAHAPCANLNGCSSALSQGYLGEVVATSASTAFVVGDRSPLLLTRNGGAGWSALPSVGDINGEPAQVAFFGARDGLVLGRATNAAAPVTLWDTVDGGSSWTAVVPTSG